MNLDAIDKGPLRVLREVLQTCPRPGNLDDLREAIDAALLRAESPPIKDTGARGQIEAFRADLARIAAERDEAREEAMARLADAEQMEAQRDQARSALAQAQEDLREARDEMESAIERSRSAEHNLKDVRDHAHAGGRREGILAALAAAERESLATDHDPSENWTPMFDGDKAYESAIVDACAAIRSLLSEPELEVSQDAAPATASNPTAIKSSAEGREVSMEDATFEAGGDSLVARLRRIVAWFAISGHRGTPCEEDLADITAAADALENTSVLKASESDAPEAGGDPLVARLRLHAMGVVDTGQSLEMYAGWVRDAIRLIREAADALEGAKERERQAAKDERATCIAELRRAEQAERNIGRHQQAKDFHGAANILNNTRLAWDRAQDMDPRQGAEEVNDET